MEVAKEKLFVTRRQKRMNKNDSQKLQRKRSRFIESSFAGSRRLGPWRRVAWTTKSVPH